VHRGQGPSSRRLYLSGGRIPTNGTAGAGVITEANRIHLVLFGVQNVTFDPYLAAIHTNPHFNTRNPPNLDSPKQGTESHFCQPPRVKYTHLQGV
jgi:hypothetical protein